MSDETPEDLKHREQQGPLEDGPPHEGERKLYPEDERLRAIQEDPDRRMTRAEWEQESLARQAAPKKHETAEQDRETRQAYEKARQSGKGKKIWIWVTAGLVVLLLLFFAGYLPRRREEERAQALATEGEHETPVVDVIRAQPSSTPGALTVPGTTSAFTVAFLYARANGYLSKRYVDIGDHVKKGQLLATIYAPDLDQQVQQAQEQLRQAQQIQIQQEQQLALYRVTWQRWRVLVAKGVFSRQDGDTQETNYTAQQALVASSERSVESYRANLGRLLALQGYEQVTAPFDGVITQRNTDIGALVGPTGAAAAAPMQSPQDVNSGSASIGSANTSGSSGSAVQSATPITGEAQGGALFGVANFDKLRILVSVPEGYVSQVHPGMPAQVFVQELPGRPVVGTVTRVAQALDQNTRTMLTEVDVANRGHKLYPGMYALVEFTEVHGTPPITVPGDAIVIRQDRSMVAVVRDGKIVMTPISIGRDYGPAVEIVDGLKPGDLVVTTVTDAVQQGVRVRTRLNAAAERIATQGAQPQQTPQSGPDQYGDQSIVNAETLNTGPQSGQQGGAGASGNQDKTGGKSVPQGAAH